MSDVGNLRSVEAVKTDDRSLKVRECESPEVFRDSIGVM